MSDLQRFTIGVSLKMYFGHEQTLAWVQAVSEIARTHPAVSSGVAEVFIIPAFPTLARAVELTWDTEIRVGAQDLFWEDSGAFTGIFFGRFNTH